LDAAKGNVYAW